MIRFPGVAGRRHPDFEKQGAGQGPCHRGIAVAGFHQGADRPGYPIHKRPASFQLQGLFCSTIRGRPAWNGCEVRVPSGQVMSMVTGTLPAAKLKKASGSDCDR